MAYETPTAGAQTGAASGPRAGFLQRFGAYFIDVIILAIPQWILTAIAPDAVGIIYVLFFLIGVAYFVYFEGGPTGQTIGKKAIGIRVYDLAQGGPIGYGRAAIRYIGRIASFIVVLLGYLWMLWDGEKQTWHDKFAGSVVVPASAYPTE